MITSLIGDVFEREESSSKNMNIADEDVTTNNVDLTDSSINTTFSNQSRSKDTMRDIHNFLDSKYPNDIKSSSSCEIIKMLLETEETFMKYKREKLAAGKTESSIIKSITSARSMKLKRCNNQKRSQDLMQEIQAFIEEKYPIDPKTSNFIEIVKSLMDTENAFVKYKEEKIALGKTKASIIKAIIDVRRLRLSRTAKRTNTERSPILMELMEVSSSKKADQSMSVKPQESHNQQEVPTVYLPEEKESEDVEDLKKKKWGGYFDSDSESL